MSDENTAYYIAAGKSLAAISNYLERAEANRKATKAFATRFGSTSWMVNNRGGGYVTLMGLEFKGKPPAGWKHLKHRGVTYDCYVPDGNTSAARKLREEIDKLTLGALGNDAGGTYTGNGSWYNPGFELLGKKYIIRHHEKAAPPVDAIPLPRSKYWAMKEKKAKTAKSAFSRKRKP
jgi:hypothetical protein